MCRCAVKMLVGRFSIHSTVVTLKHEKRGAHVAITFEAPYLCRKFSQMFCEGSRRSISDWNIVASVERSDGR